MYTDVSVLSGKTAYRFQVVNVSDLVLANVSTTYTGIGEATPTVSIAAKNLRIAGSVSAGAAPAVLTVEDGLQLDSSGRIEAETVEILLRRDPDVDADHDIRLLGTVSGSTHILGGDVNDTINLSGGRNGIHMDGGSGSDTYRIADVSGTVDVVDSGASNDFDRLVFDPAGQEATDTGSTITIDGEVIVAYEGIEEVILLPARGDFDADGNIQAADIDLLFAAIAEGSQDSRFDLNDDQRIESEDVTVLVRETLNTQFGDADLNGTVDLADFASLAEHFGQNNQGWADGDFDGDGIVQFSDFVILAENFA